MLHPVTSREISHASVCVDVCFQAASNITKDAFRSRDNFQNKARLLKLLCIFFLQVYSLTNGERRSHHQTDIRG